MVGMAHSICPFEALGAPNEVSASIPIARSTSIFFIRLPPFYFNSLTTTVAASVRSKFQAFSDAMLLEPNIAASVLSKFEALSKAISVAAHSLVALGIREMAQESFD
jgi:hypothetical protein